MKTELNSIFELRQLRIDSGISLTKLAELTGYTKGYLSALEHEHFKLTDNVRKKYLRALSGPDYNSLVQTAPKMKRTLSFFRPLTTSQQDKPCPPLPSLNENKVLQGSPTSLLLSSMSLFSDAVDKRHQPQPDFPVGIITHRPHIFAAQSWPLHHFWRKSANRLLSQGFQMQHIMDIRQTSDEENFQLLRYIIYSFKGNDRLLGNYQIRGFNNARSSVSHDMFLIPGFGALLGFPTHQYDRVDSAIYTANPDQLNVYESYYRVLLRDTSPLMTFFNAKSLVFLQEVLSLETQAKQRFFSGIALPLNLIPPEQYASRLQKKENLVGDEDLRVEFQSIRYHGQREKTFHHPYKVILAKSWVRLFLQGKAPFHHDRYQTPFSSAEAAAIISSLIESLKQLPRLEVCLLDHVPQELVEFSWYGVNEKLILISLPKENATNDSTELLRCNIQARSFFNIFKKINQSIWDEQPEANRSKPNVLQWLENELQLSNGK